MKNLLLFQPVQNLQAARRDLRILVALAAHAVVERRDDAGNLITLYLKKIDIQEAGIDPKKGIDVTIEEAK